MFPPQGCFEDLNLRFSCSDGWKGNEKPTRAQERMQAIQDEVPVLASGQPFFFCLCLVRLLRKYACPRRISLLVQGFSVEEGDRVAIANADGNLASTVEGRSRAVLEKLNQPRHGSWLMALCLNLLQAEHVASQHLEGTRWPVPVRRGG